MFLHTLPSLPFSKKVEHITQSYLHIPSEVLSFEDIALKGQLMFRLRSTISQTGAIHYTLTCKQSSNKEYELSLTYEQFALLEKYGVISSTLSKTRYSVKLESRRGNTTLDTELQFNFAVDSFYKLGLTLLEIELITLSPFPDFAKIDLFTKLRPATQTILKPYIICPFTVSNKELSLIVQNQKQ
jgi:hypothetical protein